MVILEMRSISVNMSNVLQAQTKYVVVQENDSKLVNISYKMICLVHDLYIFHIGKDMSDDYFEKPTPKSHCKTD